jgi:hypothetical protein
MSIKFLKDTAERAVVAFLASYLGAWVNAGSDFDGLTNVDSLKTGVVAAALIVAASLGLKNVGPNKESGSVLK